MELVQSNITFDNHIMKSWDYLNHPTFILNDNIHGLVRGYSFIQASDNLKTFFKQYGFKKSKKQIEKIVTDFQSIKYPDLLKLISPLQYTELPPQVKELNDKINKFYDDQKREINSYVIPTKEYMNLLMNPKQFNFK